MKKHFALVAAAGFVSLSAQAADLGAGPYVKAPVAAPPVAYLTWNKCYAGISGGYITSAGNQDTTVTPNDVNLALSQTLGNVPTSLSTDPSGGIIGGQLGCNWQTGNLVLGGETDISWTSLRSTSSVTLGAFAVTTTYHEELEAFGTARGRIGYAAGPALFYATGGLAYGSLKESASIIPGPLGQQLNGTQLAGSQTDWRWGWTAGAGIEYMFSPNWSIKGEYLYYDLGRSSLLVTTFAGAPIESGFFSHRNDGHIIRAGINYQFGGPILAKY